MANQREVKPKAYLDICAKQAGYICDRCEGGCSKLSAQALECNKAMIDKLGEKNG
jgi:hypothetical protein